MLKVGDLFPDFELPVTDGSEKSFDDLVGKSGLVMFFYPKDMTPGCTTEAGDFEANLKEFNRLGFSIVGVSKDSVKRHEKFTEKLDLTFPLISDEDGELCDFFGVWKEKSMYGKTFMGIDRSTFVSDQHGKIMYVKNKVKVKGHVQEVLDFLKAL